MRTTATGPQASPDQEQTLLVRRLRVGTLLLAAVIPLFAIIDLQRDPSTFQSLLPFKGLQATALLAIWLALNRPDGRRHAALLSRLVLLAVFLGILGHTVIRRDLLGGSLNILVTVCLEAMLIPVSAPAHLVVMSMGAATVMSAAHQLGADWSVLFNLQTLPLWIAGVGTGLVGHEAHRNRREIARQRAAIELHYQIERDRAEESETLERVGRVMIASVDTSVLLLRLCEITAEALRSDFARVISYRPEDETFSLAASVGDPAELREEFNLMVFPRRAFAPLVGLLESDGVVQIGVDDRRDLLPVGFHERIGVTRSIFVPLIPGGRLTGILVAGFRGRSAPFPPRAERIAAGIGRTAALALENARLVNELDRANSVKDEFVATMSHEFRSPLNILIGYSDLLLEGAFGPLHEEQPEIVRRLRRQSEQLLSMINATLDLSRLQSGKTQVQLAAVDLTALLAEIEQERAPLCPTEVKLEWKVSPDLPVITTDRIKLKVVINNLVSNAIKFTERGLVSISTRTGAGGIEITVADNGIGIAPEAQDSIFEPFRQANTEIGARFGGSGLGLYIVRRMLELLGGKVTLDSQLGQGSNFRVWLPS